MKTIEETYRERLKMLIAEYKTQAALARVADIAPAQISQWVNASPSFETGKPRALSSETARKLEKATGKPTGWMDQPVNTSKAAVDYNITPAPAPRGIIPVISLVQAGAWAEIVDNFEPGTAEEWVPSFGNHSKHAFAVRVEGISMQNHGHKESFDPGDIVLVDPDLPADNGALVIVRLDDRNEATFKKLHIEGTEKYLVPLNPNWPEKIIPINGNATICGVVYQKIVKF